MERNLIFDKKPEFIQDLGSGYSNVHMDIKEIEVSEDYEESGKHLKRTVKKFSANVQRVQNPVTYERTVDSAIREEFPDGEDAAALRKGVLDPNDKDFVRLNGFAEMVKTMFKNEMKRTAENIETPAPKTAKKPAKTTEKKADFWEGVK